MLSELPIPLLSLCFLAHQASIREDNPAVSLSCNSFYFTCLAHFRDSNRDLCNLETCAMQIIYGNLQLR